MRLILASTSPRRRELLQKAGIPHTVFSIKVSEFPDKNLNADEQILQIAREKAEAAFAAMKVQTSPSERFVLLSADTEVVWEGRLLGKPSSPEDAIQTLIALSGKKHAVKTGVVFLDSSTGKPESHIETTWVYFKNVSRAAIEKYVATGDPMDKAGSYGIQNSADLLVEKIEGPFDNVVGLPVALVQKVIAERGWKFA